MEIDCVFSGGGVKAYAYIGALQSVKEHQLHIKRVAGTSAGAIIASLLAADYDVDEIHLILHDLQLETLLDPPFLSNYFPWMKWLLLYSQMGMYKGDAFELWLEHLLAQKGISTFGDLTKHELKVVISDISLGKLVVIPDDLERVYGIAPETFKIATAVRMSASFPYFFMPKKLYYQERTYSYIVDGGLLSNFPLWIFRTQQRDVRPVLGMTLSDSVENVQPMKVKNGIDMYRALFLAMMRAHDTRYISRKKQDHVIFIPVKDIKTVDMSISASTKQQLIQLGKEATTTFLKTWPK